MTAQLFFASQTKFAIGSPSCQDNGLGFIGFAATGFHDLDIALKVDFDYVIHEDFGAKAFGLCLKSGHQLWALKAIHEARKILDFGGLHKLATGFDRRSDQQWVETSARGIDAGGVTRRA